VIAWPRRGGLLARSRILERLRRGEIFVQGTWTEASVRGTSYEVRIARDGLRVPAHDDPYKGVYPRGKACQRAVVLRPGEVAFVTSAECFCIPWDIGGIIGVKFSFVRSGILVHTGTGLSPGFGLTPTESGGWTAIGDERLHFFIANLSSREHVIQPGVDTIASLQFFAVDGNPGTRPAASSRELEDEYLQVGEFSGLGFFSQLLDVEDRLSRRTADVERRLNTIETGTNNIVLFGVYIVAAAFLGVVFSQILAITGNA